MTRPRALARRSATYRTGVEWIAYNDDATLTDVETVAAQLTVVLLADVFGLTSGEVALDVLAVRERDNVEASK